MTKNRAKRNFKRRASARGFGLVEVLVVVSIVVITSAIALPNFTRIFRASQLTSGTTQLADILKLSRFQAIRRNTTVVCTITGSSTQTVVSNGNGAQTTFTGAVNLVPAGGVPGTASLANAVGTGVVLVPVSSTAGTYTFDARGALSPASVYVSYLTNAAQPVLGYRAVVVLPSGSIQLWSSDAAGNWRLVE